MNCLLLIAVHSTVYNLIAIYAGGHLNYSEGNETLGRLDDSACMGLRGGEA